MEPNVIINKNGISNIPNIQDKFPVRTPAIANANNPNEIIIVKAAIICSVYF